MQKKIILTNCGFTPKTERRLVKGLGRSYALRTIEQVSELELGDVEIMFIDIVAPSGRVWLGRDKISKMPHLKMIQSQRAGVDNLDFDAIPERVIVCGNIGAYSDPIGEHTFGMILYLAKDLGVRSSKLAIGVVDVHESLFLKGKTVGIVGAGGIGQAVARFARCAGMKVLGVNSSGRSVPGFDRMFTMAKLDRVLESSDVIVLALPLNLRTLHIINKDKLQLMKKNAILINVARGHLIVEEDLYNHLSLNPEFKCGLDVWWRHPDPTKPFTQDFPFLKFANFMGTPHCSGFVPEEYEIALSYAIDNILRFVKGKKPKGVVDRQEYKGLREALSAPAS